MVRADGAGMAGRDKGMINAPYTLFSRIPLYCAEGGTFHTDDLWEKEAFLKTSLGSNLWTTHHRPTANTLPRAILGAWTDFGFCASAQ